jgi:hypothetical protein
MRMVVSRVGFSPAIIRELKRLTLSNNTSAPSSGELVMKNSIGVAVANLICALHFLSSGQAQAGTIYQTGFENPPFTVGPIAGQDGWDVFSGGGTPNAVTIQNAVSVEGSQAVEIDRSVASGQTGPFRADQSPASDNIVTMQVEAMLTSSTMQSWWQFGGLSAAPGLPFIGGFNPLPDGTIQIITAGFPVTSTAVITRDVWELWQVVYNFTSQSFDIFINNSLVASNEPFVTPASALGGGIFDTFNTVEGNDRGYFDNYSITGSAVPEPGSFALLGTGCLLLLVCLKLKSRRTLCIE